MIKSLESGIISSHVSERNLKRASIALPSLEEQEKIAVTQRRLLDLKNAIDDFENELALNPKTSSSILTQLDNVLDVMGKLTDVDEVHNLIRQGESKYIEFKETLSFDLKDKQKNKNLELSALKTVVAFLNTEGGTLLIGVADNGQISGIDIDISKLHKNNNDKFLRHFKSLLKDKIGAEFYPFIDYELIDINHKNILRVKCKQSNDPCFLDSKEFYVRTNPATDKLQGPKLVEYIKNRFG